jgi:hypothetical protein
MRAGCAAAVHDAHGQLGDGAAVRRARALHILVSTHRVLEGYSRGTRGVLEGYWRVLTGYSECLGDGAAVRRARALPILVGTYGVSKMACN